jgi:hypothetical protein
LAIKNYSYAQVLANEATASFKMGSDKYGKLYLNQANAYIDAADWARSSAKNIPDVEFSKLKEPKVCINPFEAGWNTGEFSAGLPASEVAKARLPDYVSVQAGVYFAGGGISVNTHNGDVFAQWSAGRSYPTYSFKPGLTAVVGYIRGGSAQAGGFYKTLIPFIPIGIEESVLIGLFKIQLRGKNRSPTHW